MKHKNPDVLVLNKYTYPSIEKLLLSSSSVLMIYSDAGDPGRGFLYPIKCMHWREDMKDLSDQNMPMHTEFDLIYINGDPSVSGTFNNIKRACDLLSRDGIILGENLDKDSVAQGLREFTKSSSSKKFTLITGLPYGEDRYIIKKKKGSS